MLGTLIRINEIDKRTVARWLSIFKSASLLNDKNPFIVVAVANTAAIFARSLRAMFSCGARDVALCRIIVAVQSMTGNKRSKRVTPNKYI